MPTIAVEEVITFVIGNEKVRKHLANSAAERSLISLRDYLNELGVFDWGELTISQARALIASRNLAPVIDLLQVPRGRDLAGDVAYSTYDLNRPKTSLTPALEALLSPTPNRDQEFEVLRDPADIPNARASDMLLRRRAPKEFLRRLTEGELLKVDWQNDDESEKLKQEEQEDEATSAVDLAEAEDYRPYGYLLLDASESMRTERDFRTEVGRGLAVAFLVNQRRSDNPTMVSLFRDELSPFFGGSDKLTFERAVSQVLRHTQEGMTNMQGALRQVASKVFAKTPRVDIVLITDGLTRLADNPVSSYHLHTFVLGVQADEFDKVGYEVYQDSKHKLDLWGDGYFELSAKVMRKAVVAERSDLMAITKSLANLREEFDAAASPAKIRRIQARLAVFQCLMNDYSQHHGSLDEDLAQRKEALDRLIKEIGTSDPVQVSMVNSTQWTKIDRELMLALETKELASDLNGPEGGVKATLKLDGPATTHVSAFEAIWLLLFSQIKRVARWVVRLSRLR